MLDSFKFDPMLMSKLAGHLLWVEDCLLERNSSAPDIGGALTKHVRRWEEVSGIARAASMLLQAKVGFAERLSRWPFNPSYYRRPLARYFYTRFGAYGFAARRLKSTFIAKSRFEEAQPDWGRY